MPNAPRMPAPRPIGPEPAPGRGGGPFKPPVFKMPSYKKGGTVKKTGPALVHKGEKITPVSKAKKK